MRSSAVDGFCLEYDDHPGAEGPVAVLLHGWPGDRHDYRDVIDRLDGRMRCIAPDLRGFGGSDRFNEDPGVAYSPAAQARSIIGLLDELQLSQTVLAGYDIGSRIAQLVAAERPDLVAALAITPPTPGTGSRVLQPKPVMELWYQSFHQLPLIEELVSGVDAVRSYIGHFWRHWSGPAYDVDDHELDRLARDYARPGAFVASLGWYRGGAIAVLRAPSEVVPPPEDRLSVPTVVLWPAHDPLMPVEFSDRLGEFFSDVTLERLDNSGHFVPLEAPDEFVRAILAKGD